MSEAAAVPSRRTLATLTDEERGGLRGALSITAEVSKREGGAKDPAGTFDGSVGVLVSGRTVVITIECPDEEAPLGYGLTKGGKLGIASMPTVIEIPIDMGEGRGTLKMVGIRAWCEATAADKDRLKAPEKAVAVKAPAAVL